MSQVRDTREDAEVNAWRDELAQFEKVKAQLCSDARYRHRYVALLHGSVVDADQDKFSLARRVTVGYPNQVVFIGKVQISAAVVDVPSPEIGP